MRPRSDGHVAAGWPGGVPIGAGAKELGVALAVACLLGVAVSLLPHAALVGTFFSLLAVGALLVAARKFSTRLSLFGVFLALLYAGSRDFAYLSLTIGMRPVYISEIVLATAAALLVPRMVAARRHGERSALPWPLAIYFALGAIATVRGLPAYGLEAVRDAAVCYYGIAFTLTVLMTPTWRHVRALLAFCCVGWALAGLVVVYRFFGGAGVYLELHGVTRYGAGSQALAAASSVGAAVASWTRGVTRRVRLGLVSLGLAQFLIGIILIQHRSLLVAMLATSLAILYFCISERGRILVVALWVTLGIALLPIMLGPVVNALPPLVQQTLERLQSILAPMEDANSYWRLTAWRDALVFAVSHPLLGAGFGPPLTVDLAYRVDTDVDPHNSFVTILYRLGLPGIVVLLALWLPIFRSAWVRCRVEPDRRFLIGLAMAAHLGVAVFACFNVALEGPYMGIPFWVSLALVQQASRAENVRMQRTASLP